MMLFWLAFLAVVIWIVWSIAQRGGFGPGGIVREDRAEAIVRARYARGEIDEATYHRMLDELRR